MQTDGWVIALFDKVVRCAKIVVLQLNTLNNTFDRLCLIKMATCIILKIFSTLVKNIPSYYFQ